jgi:hypothetical protein
MLEDLFCSWNYIQVLPEPLPPGLLYLEATHNYLASLPHFLPAEMVGLQLEGNRLPPLDDESPEAYMERLRSLEIGRAQSRCKRLKEELMSVCWSPDRLDHLFEEYTSPQWNHTTKSYGPLNIITHDEIL